MKDRVAAVPVGCLWIPEGDRWYVDHEVRWPIVRGTMVVTIALYEALQVRDKPRERSK